MSKVPTPKGPGRQTTLTSFFKSPASNGNSSNTCSEGPQIKRAKLGDAFAKVADEGDENEKGNNGEAPTPLTPDQKKMINEKALSARLTLASNKLKLLDPKMEKSWFAALEPEFKKEYFLKLNDFVLGERRKGTVFPPPEHVWEWAKQGPIQEVKVVILGQDPYHGPNQAHGLCFSVRKGVPPPPSLVNMFKELTEDIPGFTAPKHGCLSGWSQQGVLLLNAVLTVKQANANSHKDQGWEKITDSVISWISKNLNNVVFLLWGSYAHKKALVVDKKKHHLLQGPHPSPLSAHRGFFGCHHFSKCNEILEKNGKKPIDWNHLP